MADLENLTNNNLNAVGGSESTQENAYSADPFAQLDENSLPPSYTAPEIKDRSADGDDLYRFVNEADGKTRLVPQPTSVSENGTQINKALLQPLCDQTENLTQYIRDYTPGLISSLSNLDQHISDVEQFALESVGNLNQSIQNISEQLEKGKGANRTYSVFPLYSWAESNAPGLITDYTSPAGAINIPLRKDLYDLFLQFDFFIFETNICAIFVKKGTGNNFSGGTVFCEKTPDENNEYTDKLYTIGISGRFLTTTGDTNQYTCLIEAFNCLQHLSPEQSASGTSAHNIALSLSEKELGSVREIKLRNIYGLKMFGQICGNTSSQKKITIYSGMPSRFYLISYSDASIAFCCRMGNKLCGGSINHVLYSGKPRAVTRGINSVFTTNGLSSDVFAPTILHNNQGFHDKNEDLSNIESIYAIEPQELLFWNSSNSGYPVFDARDYHVFIFIVELFEDLTDRSKSIFIPILARKDADVMSPGRYIGGNVYSKAGIGDVYSCSISCTRDMLSSNWQSTMFDTQHIENSGHSEFVNDYSEDEPNGKTHIIAVYGLY